ncbi:UNVERIFIED_CONTAM: hypothetical protein PYX00_006253 [Menopon gallinae]|uniref:Uncharacterized protein n=1 Tax=Menopon gallinae TaxID=328185 RepID=A0AAW2HUW6_9NEOP
MWFVGTTVKGVNKKVLVVLVKPMLDVKLFIKENVVFAEQYTQMDRSKIEHEKTNHYRNAYTEANPSDRGCGSKCLDFNPKQSGT